MNLVEPTGQVRKSMILLLHVKKVSHILSIFSENDYFTGPGTLTLSSISEAVVKNINNYNKFKRATPNPFYSSNQSSISDDVELIEVPEEHKEENQHYQPPPPVIGSLCRFVVDRK